MFWTKIEVAALVALNVTIWAAVAVVILVCVSATGVAKLAQGALHVTRRHRITG